MNANDAMKDLARCNKVTVRMIGDGVAIASLFRTNTKLLEVQSDDEMVVELGFAMPIDIKKDEEKGIEAKSYSATDRKEAFKSFMIINIAKFGYVFDPTDRRKEENKFPAKYDSVALVAGTAITMLRQKLHSFDERFEKESASYVSKELLPEGSEIVYSICEEDQVVVDIIENYGNGNIKAATAKVQFSVGVGDKMADLVIEVALKSGQMSKPRKLREDIAFTATELLKEMTHLEVLPKKPVKVKPVKEDEAVEATDPEVGTAEAPVTE